MQSYIAINIMDSTDSTGEWVESEKKKETYIGHVLINTIMGQISDIAWSLSVVHVGNECNSWAPNQNSAKYRTSRDKNGMCTLHAVF